MISKGQEATEISERLEEKALEAEMRRFLLARADGFHFGGMRHLHLLAVGGGAGSRVHRAFNIALRKSSALVR
jgi:hypothetical protein